MKEREGIDRPYLLHVEHQKDQASVSEEESIWGLEHILSTIVVEDKFGFRLVFLAKLICHKLSCIEAVDQVVQ